MSILPVAAVCGLVIGLARGGRLGGLAELRFRAPLLLCVAFLAQVGLGAVSPGQRFVVVGFSYTLVGAWLVLNARRQHGRVRLALGVLTVGWLLNMLPIVLNGGMPVSLHGLRHVGAPATISVTEGHLYKHVPADRHTLLPLLGDVIPVRPFGSVISLGDIVMFAGLTGVVVAAMTRKSAVSLGERQQVCCPAAP